MTVGRSWVGAGGWELVSNPGICTPQECASRRHPTRRELLDGARSSFPLAATRWSFRVPSGTPGPGPLAPKPVTSRGGEVSPHYRAPKIRTARPRSRTRSQSAQQIAKPVTPHSRAVAKKSPPTAQPPIDSPDIRHPPTNHRPSPSITAHNRSKISSIVPTPSTARNLFCFL